MNVLRVGGVDEPFNLPWILAFENNALADLGVEGTYSNFAGGTGALVGGLEDGSIDLATVLTEGAVTAIGRGSPIRLHSAFVTSPLRWGIHVAADATQTKIAELKGKTFAISRYGSGSELMAYELADQRGWTLNDNQFVVVGGVDGAIEALPKREADIFLWERFVTAPLVNQGVFKRIGEIPTPWPSFYTAARPGLLETERSLMDQVIAIVLGYAAELIADPESTIDMIVDRYGMERSDARSWLAGVEWPQELLVDDEVLDSVVTRMVELGRLDEPIAADQLH